MNLLLPFRIKNNLDTFALLQPLLNVVDRSCWISRAFLIRQGVFPCVFLYHACVCCVRFSPLMTRGRMQCVFEQVAICDEEEDGLLKSGIHLKAFKYLAAAVNTVCELAFDR